MELEPAISPIEEEPKIKNVLEIGCGTSLETAAEHRGDGLKKARVQYVGIDMPKLFWPEPKSWEEKINQGNTPTPQSREAYIAANAKDLPFNQSSFDMVLMKSVFGELSMPDDFQSSNILSLKKALKEIYRVLDESGELIIIEENTPFDALTLMNWLTENGFKIKELVYLGTDSDINLRDTDWYKLRSKYYSGKPTSIEEGNYIIVASKSIE